MFVSCTDTGGKKHRLIIEIQYTVPTKTASDVFGLLRAARETRQGDPEDAKL